MTISTAPNRQPQSQPIAAKPSAEGLTDNPTTHEPLAISIVLYQSSQDELDKLLRSLGDESDAAQTFDVYLLDNSPANKQAETAAWATAHQHRFANLHYQASPENLGFGRGHNHVFRQIPDYRYVLILNQDIVIVKNSLKTLLAQAARDEAHFAAGMGSKVGVWEMRQVPYEHPKIYDPVSLKTDWVAGAACLFKNEALQKIGGFDEAIFMYGEDVDISWRLVIAGYECRYVPQAPVLHYSYSEPWQAKKTLIFEGCLTHLLLRARYGSLPRALRGWLMLATEILIPQEFAGRRRGLLRIIPRYFKQVWHFRRSGHAYRKTFKPSFYRWDYSIRRQGVFFETDLVEDWPQAPSVSIIIRTYNRPAALREALLSVIQQTYPHLEIVVVEDAGNRGQSVVDALRADYPQAKIVYLPQTEHLERAKCGNIGLAAATGEWMGFLDDDDLLFADHVQVLLQCALSEEKKGAYALAWEVPTTFSNLETWQYYENDYLNNYAAPFSKLALWEHNCFPFQAVLFHRSLYEQCGGLIDGVHQLEDWDLWIRYTFAKDHDFAFCEKTTSKYRIPGEQETAVNRAEELDEHLEKIIEKQAELGEISLNIAEIKALQKAYQDHEKQLGASQNYVTLLAGKNRWQRFIYRSKIKLRSLL